MQLGMQLGLQLGMQLGLPLGMLLGMLLVMLLGMQLGLLLGMQLGMPLGLQLGLPLGMMLGMPLGLQLGLPKKKCLLKCVTVKHRGKVKVDDMSADKDVASYTWQAECASEIAELKQRIANLHMQYDLDTRTIESYADKITTLQADNLRLREALNYLDEAFDSEMWNCERCGHGEETKTMDSAIYLKDFLSSL